MGSQANSLLIATSSSLRSLEVQKLGRKSDEDEVHVEELEEKLETISESLSGATTTVGELEHVLFVLLVSLWE